MKRLCAIAVVLALASGAVAQSDTFDAELETALAPAEDRAELI